MSEHTSETFDSLNPATGDVVCTYPIESDEQVRETVRFDHIVRHYHYSHATINPYRIIPINPQIDWDRPHGRG